MNTGVISTRYAKALLDYAKEQGVEDAVYESMKQLINTHHCVKDFMPVLRSPTLPQDKRVELLCSAVAPSDVFRRFAALVVKEEREELLLFIAYAYLSLYRREKNIRVVRLTTATELPVSLKERIKLFLSENENRTVEMENVVDDSLIGGFIVEVDSTRLDASVKGQLRDIRKQLVKHNRKLV